ASSRAARAVKVRRVSARLRLRLPRLRSGCDQARGHGEDQTKTEAQQRIPHQGTWSKRCHAAAVRKAHAKRAVRTAAHDLLAFPPGRGAGVPAGDVPIDPNLAAGSLTPVLVSRSVLVPLSCVG